MSKTNLITQSREFKLFKRNIIHPHRMIFDQLVKFWYFSYKFINY